MSLVRPNISKTKTDKETETVEEEVVMTEEIVEQEIVEPEATQEVTVQQSKAVAASPQGSMTAMAGHLDQLEQEGFSDLEVSALSFDRVKLHEGSFKIGDNEEDLGKNIKFKVMTTRAVYLFSQSDDDDAETFYSYCPNGTTMTDGTSSAERLAEWKADGYEPVSRAYQEAMVELVDREDEWEGSVVSLSIPPASRSKFGGVISVGTMRNKCSPADLVISATPSEVIKAKGGQSYRRWNFRVERVEV